ncbi:putative PAS/PAC sensor protein [Haladaptatus paucihalophilus DX253]|uniref:PAS domain S-box-containing protein n=1 Tax=Haladaptatus paucihalophilus DX253 TaxID=797209 RepID=E7QUU4_HALPU|nr:bacterio-opsin activator domain-containing protein [Haladaptatus paucihalophilus]EFW91751.1 putative PAS/PAC sensor protein [Haladaptatus paucihalophilus DX253]SHJ95073.1 PAS domain S-box-containing protein [Haladaptatus paucihalophilus DX253]
MSEEREEGEKEGAEAEEERRNEGVEAEKERRTDETRLLATEKVVAAIGDGIYQLDPAGRFVSVNDATVEATGYDRAELLGEHASLLVDEPYVTRVEDEIADLLANEPGGVRAMEAPIRNADGERVPCELRFSVVLSDGEFEGTVGVVRDISWEKRRDAALRAQRDELEQLRHINAVVRSIDRAVVRADTADEIERTVCDRIADADPYRFALVARFDRELETLTVVSGAGIDEEDAERLRRMDFDASDGPAIEAIRNRSVWVVQDADRGDEWGASDSDAGRWSMAFVPFRYDDSIHGVLGVYADRPFAFEGPEREVLGELGQMVGYALSAVKTRQALVSERTIELTFRFSEDDYPFTALTKQVGGTSRFEDAVLHPDGSLLLYVSTEGSDPERVLEFFEEFEGVTHFRAITQREDECLLEVRYAGPMAFSTLANHGGIIRSAVAEEGVAHVTVDIPETGDVREVVNAMTGVFEDAELVSRQTVEQPTETRARFRDTLDDRLTERQLTALTTAYRAGYYDWPRGSTGEELAESLDIAPPTLHKHLRIAERKVLSAIFDEPERD